MSEKTHTYEITLKNCAFFAHHGVFEEETKLGQRFFVDATLKVEPRGALEEDLAHRGHRRDGGAGARPGRRSCRRRGNSAGPTLLTASGTCVSGPANRRAAHVHHIAEIRKRSAACRD